MFRRWPCGPATSAGRNLPSAGDYIAQNEKAAIESIQTSATQGAATGSAASKKQPTFEQFSRANIFTLHWRHDPAGDPSRLNDPSTRDRN